MRPSRAILVYGATGTLGGLVAGALDERGAHVIVAGRDAARVGALAAELGCAARIARDDDRAALAALVEGVRVVVDCAGPFAGRSTALIEAAIAAGAAYVDVASEPAFLREVYERCESAARRAGVACVTGAGVAPGLGDLAAAWATAQLIGAPADEDVVRTTLAPRAAVGDPLDEIAITWILDGVAAAPGAQRAGIAMLTHGGELWRDGRWDRVAPGAATRTIDAGPALGGRRLAVSAPGGEVVTVPRHVDARRVQTFASVTRAAWAMRAAGLAARALPALGGALGARMQKWAPAPPPSAQLRARARFAVFAQVRRGADHREVAIHGADLYATAAAITAWLATVLAARATGPVGVLAPAEVVVAGPALAALADAAELELVSGARS
jgi:short subunit dehydrogenase-like uncharacterized protein